MRPSPRKALRFGALLLLLLGATAASTRASAESARWAGLEAGLRIGASWSSFASDTRLGPLEPIVNVGIVRGAIFDDAFSPMQYALDVSARVWLPWPASWLGASAPRLWLEGGYAHDLAAARDRNRSQPPFLDPFTFSMISSPFLDVAYEGRGFLQLGAEWRLGDALHVSPFLGFEVQEFSVEASGIAVERPAASAIPDSFWQMSERERAYGLALGLRLRLPFVDTGRVRSDLDLAFSYTEFLSDPSLPLTAVTATRVEPQPLSLGPGGVLRIGAGLVFRFGIPPKRDDEGADASVR